MIIASTENDVIRYNIQGYKISWTTNLTPFIFLQADKTNDICWLCWKWYVELSDICFTIVCCFIPVSLIRESKAGSAVFTLLFFLTVILLAILVGFLTFMALMSTCIFSSLFYIFFMVYVRRICLNIKTLSLGFIFLHLRARLVCFNKVILLNMLTDVVSVLTPDCLFPRKQVQLLWGDLEFSFSFSKYTCFTNWKNTSIINFFHQAKNIMCRNKSFSLYFRTAIWLGGGEW